MNTDGATSQEASSSSTPLTVPPSQKLATLEADDTDGPTEVTPLLQTAGPSESEEASGGIAKWGHDLVTDFGWQLLGLLFCAQHVSKGFVASFVGAGYPYVMEAHKVNAAQMSTYMGIIQLPWALKPALGILSDAFPIMGYSRLPYLLAATIIGVAALTTIGSLQMQLDVQHLVIMLFFVALYCSTVDLLTEAIYARALREKPSHGPSLLSFVWGGMTIAGILATVSSGLILEKTTPFALYNIAVPFAGLILGPILMNWMGEPRLTSEEIAAQRSKILSQKMTVMLACVMMLATVVLAYTGMKFNAKQNAIISAAVCGVVLLAFSVALNPVIAKVNAFSLIQTAMSITLGGSAFYFMTDNEEQYKEGPHFSKNFYNITIPLCGKVFTVIGIWIYNKNAGEWTYQRMYIIGNFITVFASLSDVIFYKRLNVDWGIPDTVFVLGSSAFQNIIETWLWMPSVVLLSQLCPKGMEAIMYANLAGCHNLGNTLSANFGALMLESAGVTPNGTSGDAADFQNLWWLSLICSMLPLLPVILVPWFIPNKMNTERIFEEDDIHATSGSLLQAWGLDSIPEDDLPATSRPNDATGRTV